MIQYSYEQILKIAKKIRGFTLDDFPGNFQEIMEAFDNRQDTNANAVQIASELLDDTRLWMGILSNNKITEGARYMVASNKIACTCIDILNDTVESTCSKASGEDLQPHICHDLSLKANELLNMLSQIKQFCVVPETHKMYEDMVKKLLIAQDHVEAFVVSD